MRKERRAAAALRAAFPHTIPILTGFLFLGMTYGIYAKTSGFSFLYPMAMSTVVFAGSAEFLMVQLLQRTFQPLHTFLMILMLNARHLFYGVSMLEKYRSRGWKKGYLVFGLCDETFSVACTAPVPPGVDEGWFYFFITLLDQCYWIMGATLGGLFGMLIHFSTEGIEFVMTAMFVVIFLNQWMNKVTRSSAVMGLIVSALSLAVFGADQFLIPSMIGILALIVSKDLLRKGEEKACK